jgi:signal transduction histidine kinase
VNSLERRLQAGLAVSLVLLMGLLWWLVNMAIGRLTEDYVASRLSHDGETLLAAIAFGPDGAPVLDAGRLNVVYEQPLSGHYYLIQPEAGESLHSPSSWDTPLEVAALEPGRQRVWQLDGPVAVAEDLSPLTDSLRRFNGYFAALVGLVLLVTLGVQQVVVRKSFRPLRRVREEIRRLEEGEIGQLPENVPAEVRPLVAEVNRLLDLVAQRLQRSRNALGNLAHALKGPLHLVTQITRGEALADNPEVAAELEQHTDRIRQLMERELRRARLAGSGAPGRRFRPVDDLEGLVTVLERIHDEHRVHIALQFDGPDRAVQGDRDDLLELFGNLLDNACKWSAGRVRCRVETHAGLAVDVEDDGPGCDGEQLDQLTGRGVRIDESVAGHGLGLSIVKDIVQLYGGSLRFDRSPELGGLRVRVRLPGI